MLTLIAYCSTYMLPQARTHCNFVWMRGYAIMLSADDTVALLTYPQFLNSGTKLFIVYLDIIK